MTPIPFRNVAGSPHTSRNAPETAARARTPADWLAFLLSALVSPYLVLPLFALTMAWHYSPDWRHFLWWGAISSFFSTCIPVLYILLRIHTGQITDIHVMQREQRNGPFLVALFSSAAGSALLYHLGAPLPIVIMGIGVVANGIVFLLITLYWKISMHPSVFTAAVITASYLIDPQAAWLLLLVPVIVWARLHRSRHNLAQGIVAIAIASLVTLAVLASFGYIG